MSFSSLEMATHRPRSHSNAAVAEKVLRRAEIAKVARNLQDCLALANFKAQNGWQNKPFKAIEPEVTEQLKMKRPFPHGDLLSDSSSSTSDNTPYASSPLTGPIFSDEVMPGSSHSNRSRLGAPAPLPHNPNKRLRANSNNAPSQRASRHVSWKATHHLAQSSPVFRRPVSSSFNGQHSFVSDSATIPLPTSDHSPMFSRSSDRTIAEDDSDNDLPMHSFNQRPASSSMISSSPPRTPPPTRHSKSAMGGGSKSGAAADLLLYLANSPSRSPVPRRTNQFSPGDAVANPPSTPPSSTSHLPSSILATPSNSHNLNTSLFNGALATTPGNNSNFNFADFVNVTPSPAQVSWGGRTPGGLKTPLAARVARRGLNFDALVPPGSESGRIKEDRERKGLALELGEELMPRR